jgi:hypothetical protein
MLSTQTRIQKYALHLGLSLIAPLLLTMVLIIISGDREFGMVYGIISGLMFLNLFYAFYFLKSKFWINLVSGLFVTTLSCGVVYVILTNKIKPDFEFYGIYTALFSYGISSIVAWEICYQVLKLKNSNDTNS